MTSHARFLEGRLQRVRRWALAAATVVAVHVGFVSAAMLRMPDDPVDDESAGAMLLDLAPLAIAAPLDAPDLPPGPLAADSQPALPTVREETTESRVEVPPADPSPLAPDPAVALPTPPPMPDKKPEDEQPKPEERREAADRAADASVASAPPRVVAPKEAPAAAAPSGAPEAVARARTTWERSVVMHLSRHKRYPAGARSLRQQGSVSVVFTMDRQGHVIAARVLVSSGSPLLDEEATAVLKRASPLPAPPATVGGATFELVLPIQFRIR